MLRYALSFEHFKKRLLPAKNLTTRETNREEVRKYSTQRSCTINEEDSKKLNDLRDQYQRNPYYCNFSVNSDKQTEK